MLAFTFIIPFIFSFLGIDRCLAYYSQWVPSFYSDVYRQPFQTLKMHRGSCTVSLNAFRNKHFNVEIPLVNGSTPAGFCTILFNSVDNLNLAIAIEQGLTDVNNNVLNQNIKLFKVKNGTVKLIYE